MPELRFLGLKKSTIKKIPPFKYFFDWRDKRIYLQIYRDLKNSIEDVSPGEGIVHFEVNNKIFKLNFRKFPCSDLNVFYQIFILKCYEPLVQKCSFRFRADEQLRIVDAGANVGYSAIYFKAFFPNAEIVAIEPDEKNSQQLLKNISLNKLHLKNHIQGALWPHTALLELHRDFRDNRDAAITVNVTKDKNGINGLSLEQVLEQNNWEKADIVKMDIEGSERFLFDTEKKADDILNKTDYLAIEIHDEFHIRDIIYKHLVRNNFTYFESNDLTIAFR